MALWYGRGMWAWGAGLAILLVLGGAVPPAAAETEGGPLPIVTLDAIPLGIPAKDLPEAARIRAEAVLSNELFSQRVSGIRYRSREAVFEFLVDHPDFAASVARALRVGQYRLRPVAEGYEGDDNRGARGTIRLLYTEPGRRLYHLEGRYDTRGLPTIAGEMLVLLEYHHEADGQGGTQVDSSLSGHLRVDTPVVGALAGVLSGLARPLIARAVEQKVRRFFNTVARVSRWAYDEPEQLAAALDGHPEVEQGPTLEAFTRILLADRPPLWVREPFRLTVPEPTAP